MTDTYFEMAKKKYVEFGLDFEQSIDTCMNDGWVVSTPYIFAMGLFYIDNGKTVCFVEYAHGEINTLLGFCFDVHIDYIEFCRRGDMKVKRYEFERFRRLTDRVV